MLRVRRRLNNKSSLQLKTETSDTVKQCTICLDVITSRGQLSVCNHLFCYECIFEWSKVGTYYHVIIT